MVTGQEQIVFVSVVKSILDLRAMLRDHQVVRCLVANRRKPRGIKKKGGGIIFQVSTLRMWHQIYDANKTGMN